MERLRKESPRRLMSECWYWREEFWKPLRRDRERGVSTAERGVSPGMERGVNKETSDRCYGEGVRVVKQKRILNSFLFEGI